MPSSPQRRRVVITGMGSVTPLGLDAASTWAALIEGRCAVDHIRAFDASGFPVQIAAEVPAAQIDADFRAPKLRKYADRKIFLAVRAAEEAMAQAGMAPGGFAPQPGRFGVSVGTEAGRPLLEDVASRFYHLRDHERAGGDPMDALQHFSPLEFVTTMPHLTATLLAALFAARGPSLTCSTACTSAAQALGEAALAIRRGHAEIMLAGGTDALVEAFMVTGFALLGALSQRNDDPRRASRPFDLHRDGFILGEGAGFVVMEDLEHARARGATVLAEVCGYGCSSNAYRITDSPPDGRGAAQSMRWALKDAGLTPEQIHYINAHGTSTPMNDASESRGIRQAFGAAADKVAVSSTKSMMGHLVASCGVVESIACIQAIRDGIIPPTINYETPDPNCDLDYVPNEARRAPVRYAMTNSFGFGGSNGTLIFGPPEP